MYRLALPTLLALTIAGLGCAAAASASATPHVSAAPHAADAPACTPEPDTDDQAVSVADLNADGYADLVVGVPDASASGLTAAGVEDIHYPHVTNGLSTQHFGESYFGQTPAAGDHFGASTAYTAPIAQFNGCYGLAIGAPGAAGGRGRVTLAHGTNSGISPDDATVLTGPVAGAGFGSTVVADNTEIWVAAPDASVDGHAGAGAVYHYHYNASASQATLVQVVTENSPNVPGSAATGDHFGQALSVGGDLAVGIPGKAVDGAAGAGAVALLRPGSGGAGQIVGGAVETQDSKGVPGGSEAGDALGSSVSFVSYVLAAGVPGEDIGKTRNAGSVQTFYDEPTKHAGGPVVRLGVGEAITQESPTVPGGSETGDRFGAAVQVGAGDNDGGNGERPQLWIGAPGESIGNVRASGDVIPLRRAYNGQWRLDGSAIRLGSGGLPGTPQTAAHVGATLGLFSGTYFPAEDDVVNGEGPVVDVPAVDSDGTNAGEVDNVGGYNVMGAGVYRDSAGPQAGEFYGVAASNISNGTFDDG